MKTILPAIAAALLSTAAYAADAEIYYSEPAAVDQYSWSGFYVGGNVGYGGGSTDITPFMAPFPIFEANGGGFVGGLQAGYNWQAGALVFGVETDIQLTNIEASVDQFPLPVFESEIEWFGTTRARLGYLPTDRVLIYGTGGFAYGAQKVMFSGLSDSDTRTGWAVGGGAEFAINDKLTVKGEYLYTDLGRFSGDIITFPFETEFNFHTVRTGVNIRF